MFSKSMKFSEEQIESLVEVVEELVEENETLAETLEEIKEKLDEVAEKVDAVEGEVSSDEYKNMRSQIKDVNAKFAKLDNVITNLPDNNPGDKGPKNTLSEIKLIDQRNKAPGPFCGLRLDKER